MTPPGLREKKKRRTEASIVEAALTLFNERGFRAATMEEVAERAEAAVGTLYNYFESKSHILVAVLLNETEKYTQEAALKAAGVEGGRLSRLNAYSDVYLSQYSAYDKPLWCEMLSGLFKEPSRAALLFNESSAVLIPITGLLGKNIKEVTTQIRHEASIIHSNIMASLLQYLTDEEMGIEEAQKNARELIRRTTVQRRK